MTKKRFFTVYLYTYNCRSHLTNSNLETYINEIFIAKNWNRTNIKVLQGIRFTN